MTSWYTAPFWRLCLAISLSFMASAGAAAQTADERRQHVREALRGGDLSRSVSELTAWRAADTPTFVSNDYSYLLGRLDARAGNMAGAFTQYQSALPNRSILTQYSLWHMAQFARSTGDLALECEYLRRLLATAPGTALRDAVVARLGGSLLESGDYGGAILILRTQTGDDNAERTREARAAIADALLLSGQRQAARDEFSLLAQAAPDPSRPDDVALHAVRALDLLDSNDKERPLRDGAPGIPLEDQARRAAVYNFNREFGSARLHYEAMLKQEPDGPHAADALFQLGRGYYQEDQFEKAVEYFGRLLDRYAGSSNARDAALYTGAAYVRLKRTDDAVAAYEQSIERFPGAPNPEREFLNIVDALRDGGRDSDALDWVKRTRDRFKGQRGEVLALFEQARIHLAQDDFAAALDEFSALRSGLSPADANTPGGTTAEEVAFLRAFTLEARHDYGGAIDSYLAIPDGRNEYYGRRATQRLLGLAAGTDSRSAAEGRLDALLADAERQSGNGSADEARRAAQQALRLTNDPGTRGKLLETARRAYEKLPLYATLAKAIPDFHIDEPPPAGAPVTHENMATRLLFLELYDEGAPELAIAEPGERRASQPDAGLRLAIFFKRGGFAGPALRYAEPLWKNAPQDFLIELAQPEVAELLYPAPYAAALLEYAPDRHVDPRFILAIARQESRFAPDAKSGAAARGLLQFIPSTATEIATQMHVAAFNQDELYDPEIAILFGAQYMGNLFQRFPLLPQAVAASYNGGEENVARWITRSRSNEPDRFVPEIGFSQTKDYVFKVLANYWAYQTLYTERLQKRTSIAQE